MSAQAAIVPGVDLDVESLMRLRLLLRGRPARLRLGTPAPGSILRRRSGAGGETYDVRPWSEGDDLRRLDRNVTARTGAPHVRTTHEERGRSNLYLLDFRPPMLFGTRRAFRSVAAAEAAVLCAWRALDMQGRVGFAAAGASEARFLGWAGSARTFAPLLCQLAAMHRTALDAAGEREPALAGALGAIEGMAGAAAITLVTGLDAPGESFDAIAERIARRRGLDLLLIVDRFELAPPRGVYPFRTRGGEAGRLRIPRDGDADPRDGRVERMRRLGARVEVIDAGVDVAATARTLERFHGPFA